MTALTLAELERRFDGPVPAHLRAAARGLNVELLHATGNAVLFKTMALRQIATIRARRADGSFYPALIADLRLYVERWRHWRVIVRRYEECCR